MTIYLVNLQLVIIDMYIPTLYILGVMNIEVEFVSNL